MFIARPALASQLFGLPARSGAWPYVRALGFRDLGVAAALGLASVGPPRVLGALAGSLAIIPAADLALVAALKGGRAWPSLILHGASGATLLALAVGGLAARRRNP